MVKPRKQSGWPPESNRGRRPGLTRPFQPRGAHPLELAPRSLRPERAAHMHPGCWLRSLRMFPEHPLKNPARVPTMVCKIHTMAGLTACLVDDPEVSGNQAPLWGCSTKFRNVFRSGCVSLGRLRTLNVSTLKSTLLCPASLSHVHNSEKVPLAQGS